MPMNSLFWNIMPVKSLFYPRFRNLFAPRYLSWTPQAPLPVARRSVQAVAVNDKIFVFGGDELDEIINGHLISVPGADVLEYDMSAKSWSTVSTMPTPRSGCMVFRYGTNKICVVGGFEKRPNQWTKSDKIEIFDWTTNTWSSGGVFVMPTILYSAVLIEDRYIFTFGGMSGEASGWNDLTYVFRHDLQERTASWPGTFAPMPTARKHLTAVVGAQGLIYAMGGMNDEGVLATVEAYDPDENTWQTRAPMLVPRREFAAVVGPNGFIYVFGGMCGGAAMPYAERYDPFTDSWTPAPDLPGARMSHAAVIGQDNRIFVIGGQQKESCFEDPVFLDSVVATTQPVTN